MFLSKNSITSTLTYCVMVIIVLNSCKKDPKIVPDNTAPYYAGVSTVKLENYVNRLFIDLIGREALQSELSAESAFLRSNGLTIEAREALIIKLQTDITYLQGDSSYKYAYHTRLYELNKARFLEGASLAEFLQMKGDNDYICLQDSLSGDSLSFKLHKEYSNKLARAIKAKDDFMNDSININQYYFRLIDNSIYDKINMNSFNFIRATFNDLFFRYPSSNEFNASYSMVDANNPAVLFGQSGQSKSNYLNILIQSNEFDEGMIRWLYQTFLSRQPNNKELSTDIFSFHNDKNIQKAQRNILKSDEYANF